MCAPSLRLATMVTPMLAVIVTQIAVVWERCPFVVTVSFVLNMNSVMTATPMLAAVVMTIAVSLVQELSAEI